MFGGLKRRGLCIGLLGALALPGLMTAAVELHLLLDPHHSTHAHAWTLAEAASMASHGHAHPPATPEHDHATLPPQWTVGRSLGNASWSTGAGVGPAKVSDPAPELPRGVGGVVRGFLSEGLPPPSRHRLCTLLL
jgi:hypothetical protein